jgi:FkbM family methyltransferase
MNFLRQTAEHVFGPVVLRRRLPKRFGSGIICVSAQVGGLKYVFRQATRWDPELLRIASVLVRPGASVWDVGANVGLFSRAAAFLAGPDGLVLALEADTDAVTLLNRTARARRKEDAALTVIPVSVGRSTGFIDLAIARRARAANAISGFGSSQTGGVLEERTVPCTTLDALFVRFGAPSIIKIDVEGAELDVLEGGRIVLQQHRPVIYCEVRDHSRSAVSDHLVRAEYQCFDGAAYPDAQPCSDQTRDIVAVPNELAAD